MAVITQRMEAVEGKVDRLEALFGQFMAQTGNALQRIDRSVERIDRSVERVDHSIDRIDHSIDRMEATVAEMKAEGAREREEGSRERREMNKRWGELANKMGTIVEDIIAPSLRRMAPTELGCGQMRSFTVRSDRTRSDDPSRRREFDALYVGERAVLLNETKSAPRTEDVRAFVDFLRSGEFALYFPEYSALPVTPVFSSLFIPADLVTYLTRNGIYAVAMGEESAQILNLAEVREQQAL